MSRSGLLVLLGLLALLGGCGSRPAVMPGDDGRPTRTPPDGGSEGECVVAVRLDTCCPRLELARASALQGDPCLVPYSPAPKVPAICQQHRANHACAEEPCAPLTPKTLLAAPDSSGQCTWKSECAVDADCAFLEDCRGACCSCGFFPIRYGAQQPCILGKPGAYPVAGCGLRCEPLCWPPGPVPPAACWPVEGEPGLSRCSDGRHVSPNRGYLLWQAPMGESGVGPALELRADGRLRTWRQVGPLQPHPAGKADRELQLDALSVAPLFAQLAAVDFSGLPHHTTAGWECDPSLYLERCTDCAPITLRYGGAGDLLPELQAVYASVEKLLATSVAADQPSPSQYCVLD